MNLLLYLPIVKYFFIILCSIYTYIKLYNFPFTRKGYFLIILFSATVSPITLYTQKTLPLYTILSMTFIVALFCGVVFHRNILQTLCISILTIGNSYVLFTLVMLLFSPLTYLLYRAQLSESIASLIILLIVGSFQNIIICLLFRTRRFRDGILNITNIFSNNTVLCISALLILFSSMFFINDDFNLIFDQLLIIIIFSLSLLAWLWWQKTIQTDYINKNNSQQIDLLENKLQERDAELERLSKIIHKDNKLLAALELSTRELLQDTSSEKAESLLQELNRFSKERSETLHAYEAGQAALPKTGLFSIDTMLNYLHQRALKHRIAFQLSLEDEIAGITDIISEQDLSTIIADLGENAIIATKDVETKNIRLSIERKTDGYALYFYDSGEPFAQEVLESFGKTRCTTHAETGGSGIGLVTTGELAAKYHGEFYITDEDVPQPYTKCVSVILKQGS